MLRVKSGVGVFIGRKSQSALCLCYVPFYYNANERKHKRKHKEKEKFRSLCLRQSRFKGEISALALALMPGLVLASLVKTRL